jgi:hypothetical protein
MRREAQRRYGCGFVLVAVGACNHSAMIIRSGVEATFLTLSHHFR